MVSKSVAKRLEAMRRHAREMIDDWPDDKPKKGRVTHRDGNFHTVNADRSNDKREYYGSSMRVGGY